MYVINQFMDPAKVFIASPVASHTCTFGTLL